MRRHLKSLAVPFVCIAAFVLLLLLAMAPPGGAIRTERSLAPRAASAGALASAGRASPPILAQWGTQGSGNGQFGHPAGIAIDAMGDVYVSDQANNRVQEFTADGTYVTQWGKFGTDKGQFGGIQRLAVGPNSDVFVCDQNTSRVQRFTASGTFLNQWVIGQYQNPWGIAVDSTGAVYVANRTKSSVQKYTSSGDLLTQWGSSGTGPVQFGDLTGIAVALSGHVFTCDGGNSRITEFSADGDVLKQWASPRSGSDPGPFAIAVDRAGRVYALYASSYQRVLVFSPNGDLLTQWDVTGAAALWDIAVDATGDVYVVDHQNCWVRKYGPVVVSADKTPPTTKVSGVDKKWHNRPVTLTFTATDNAGGSGVAYTEYRLRDPYGLGWQDWQKSSTVVAPASIIHTDDGTFKVQYRSVDKAGNVEQAKEAQVLIDTTPPDVIVLPATATHGHTVVVNFKVTDKLSPQFRVVLATVTGPGPSRTVRHKASSQQWLKIKGLNGWSFTCNLSLGTYRTHVTVCDLAGNDSAPGLGKLVVK